MKRKPSAKKKPSQPARVAKFSAILRFLKKHKLVTFLSLLLLLYPASILQSAYEDWDNAQLIKGLARDFPALVTDIEAATNLDLDIKVDCMTTTEKLGGGVRTCEMSVVGQADQEKVQSAIDVVTRSNIVTSYDLSENNLAYKIYYRNEDICSLSNRTTIFLTCLTAVREKNIELAKKLFTQIKNDQD